MDTNFNKLSSSGKRYLAKATMFSLAGGAVLAAAFFFANNQPWGYVAPPALSGTNFKQGNVIAYAPWFEQGSFRGDLLASPVGADGKVALLATNWRASPVLDGQDYLNGRNIVTTDGDGSGIPFRFADLTAAQQLQVESEDILNYIRGDRSNESDSDMRIRTGVLGDIIHSGPVYVGKPIAGYNFGNYLGFANSNAGRAGRVYVGANDGMLHAFDASDGSEVFAYVPSMVMDNLPKLTAQPYSHQYFVDGFLTVEDAEFGGSWHSVLVGGLGAGGKGYYGLDVTSPAAASEVAAAGKILWEFHSASTGATNLGYSYSRPSIIQYGDGDWGAVVGNGYLSATGAASLYILDLQTGAVIREIVVTDGDDNGMSSPTVVDTDGDGIADAAYAGDLNGNLWKFNLGPGSPGSWGVAYSGQPLFQTATGQPITTAPEVGRHPEEGVMVYIGTGQLLSASDGADKTTQAVYGLWDNGAPISSATLLQQQLKSTTHASGVSVRVATNNRPDWEVHGGWMTPTEIVGASALDQGERVIQDPLLRDGRISIMTVNPTISTGDNWFIQLDALTGGAPDKTIFDVSEDSVLNVADNADGSGDGVVADVHEDRVVGQYQAFGLASRPVIGVLGTSSDAALINHLSAIPPNPIVDPDDPGLLGGHFDLDTSSQIYPFSGGDTDGHVHEWDDQHDLTTINYFDLPDGDGDPLYEISSPQAGVGPSDIFILTVANSDLSPGGVLEINGMSISVTDYQGLLNRYLSDTMLPGEKFPRYKINPPNPAQAAAGIEKLDSLKLSFDAFAILSGDLIPTKTGCVRGNDAGALGEYRNGALMIQALDGQHAAGGFTFNAVTQQYETNSAAIHGALGYATDGLLWETTVFWHWDDGCYGESEWAPIYESCIVEGGGECLSSSDDKKKKGKKKKKKTDEAPVDPAVPSSVGNDPGHSVTTSTIAGSNDTGRLFWKELVPQE